VALERRKGGSITAFGGTAFLAKEKRFSSAGNEGFIWGQSLLHILKERDLPRIGVRNPTIQIKRKERENPSSRTFSVDEWGFG